MPTVTLGVEDQEILSSLACRRKHRRAFGLRPVPSLPSRPFGFNPSRLRACGAARFACLEGIGARPIPATRSLAPL